jgi:beta-lactamase class A
MRMSPARLALVGGAFVALAGALSLVPGDDPDPAPREPAGASAAAEPATEARSAPQRRERTPPRPRSNPGASFDRLAAQTPGELAIAVVPFGEAAGRQFGDALAAHAWSTMKVPIVAALMRERRRRGGLSEREAALAAAALTRSDNDAAATLFETLGEVTGGRASARAALEALLEDAGDNVTTVNRRPRPPFSTYGQTIWSPARSARFYATLGAGCLLEPAESEQVLRWMRDVVPDQRWGAGAVAWPRGTRVALKGGWGPEADGRYLVRQSAVVARGGRGYGVSIVVLAPGGDDGYAHGRTAVTAAAAWVARHFDPREGGAAACPLK